MIERLFCALAVLLFMAGCAQVSPPPVATSCYHLNPEIETAIGYCQAMKDELKSTLQANGLDFENVVKENVFTTDLDAFIRNKDVRRTYYGQHLPAASWVEVRRLYSPAFVVEIELTAVK